MDNRFGTSRLRLWAVVGRGHDEPMFKAVTTVCHLISCEQKGDLSEGDQQLLFWSAEAVEAFVLFFCILMCVCVFFWGDHDLKVDFDGTEGIYIYIYTDRFWAVGLSKWYWLWFLLIYVHIYVAKFIIHCHMILLPAPSCAIFHVLGLPPVAPKRIVTGALWFWGFWKSFNVARPRGNATSWCPSATSLSWPRQTCQSGLAIQLERNLLLLFQLLLEHRHLTTRNFHISFTFIYHLTIIPAEKSSISNAFFLLW